MAYVLGYIQELEGRVSEKPTRVESLLASYRYH